VACSVSDSGAGLTSDVLARLFTPYFTTKGPGRGTGLGLFVVKQIVEGAGGRILVDTKPGHGATFSVVLPLSRTSGAGREGTVTERAGTPNPGPRSAGAGTR
jgi:signal transduction histidine kinase